MNSKIQLFLTFCSGTGLVSKDSNGKSDPFLKSVLLNSGGKPQEASRKQTKVVRKTLNPEWNEKVSMRASSPDDVLLIECWDWDRVGQDDFMGQVSISVKELMDRFHDQRRMNLGLTERPGAKKKEGVKGFLTIKLNGVQVGGARAAGRAALYSSGAAVGSSVVAMRERMSLGDDLRVADPVSGLTPLQQAAYVGDLATVKVLLEQVKVDVNASGGQLRWPALLYAAHEDQARVLKYLLTLVDPTVAHGQAGVQRLALHVAAQFASVHALKILLQDERCDCNVLCERWLPNEQPERGTSALHLAARNYAQSGDRLETLRALLDAGANVEQLDCMGRTPLFYAVASGAEELVALLVEAGAKKDLKDAQGACIDDLLETLKRNNKHAWTACSARLK